VTSLPDTPRNSAARSSLRASLIADGGGVLVLAGGAVGEGTTRERHTWAEDKTPWNRVV